MTKINLIDVGAVGGFDRPWSQHKNSLGTILSFEPNEKPNIIGDKIKYDCAVWNYDGEAQFHVYGERGCGSSILKQNTDWVRDNFETIKDQGSQKLNSTWFDRSREKDRFQCVVKKLDTILAELQIARDNHTPFHFLKSDTQSGEFFVLEGAREYLKNDCLGLELELYRYPLYDGMVLEDKVKNFLEMSGFEILGWTGYKNSFLSQADYVFIRQDPRSPQEEKIINKIKHIYAPKGPEKIIKSRTLVDKIFDKARYMLKFS